MSDQLENLPSGVDRPPGQQETSVWSRVLRFVKRSEQQENELKLLTRQVLRKLMQGISEKGYVTLRHEKDSGKLRRVGFLVFFKSRDIPRLRVHMVKHENPDSGVSLMPHDRLVIQATEADPSKNRRDIAIVNSFGMPEGEYKFLYRRDADQEDSHNPIPRSTKEKIGFLRQILETEVDEKVTEDLFGQPYQPGVANEPYTRDMDGTKVVVNRLWVRDIKSQALMDGLQQQMKPLME